MKTDNSFDPKKRRTLKLITGITSTGVLAAMPAIASAQYFSPKSKGELIECKLISRSDLSRAYLLMHNKTDQEIAAARFSAQTIIFDDTTLDMAASYVEPVLIPPHDRVMVRLNLEAGLQPNHGVDTVIDMNSQTQYLQQGTRVVDLKIRVEKGVATIDHHPVLRS